MPPPSPLRVAVPEFLVEVVLVKGAGVIPSAMAIEFEEAAKGRDAKLVANWLSAELFARLNKLGVDITQSPISPNQLGELVELISVNCAFTNKEIKNIAKK